MENVIRPSLPDPDAARPRRPLVARIYDALRRPDVKVEQFRLRRALIADDRDAIVKAARNLTSEQRLEVLEQVEEIKKSGAAMPADASRAVPTGPTKTNWASAFRLPRWGGRPAQPTAQPGPAGPAKPRIQIAPFTGTGPRYALTRGMVVHFDWNGNRITAKVTNWGRAGAEVAGADGAVYQVEWKDLRPGVAPEQEAEHRDRLAKSRARDRDREFRETVEMLTLSPEDRAAWWARRHGDDLP